MSEFFYNFTLGFILLALMNKLISFCFNLEIEGEHAMRMAALIAFVTALLDTDTVEYLLSKIF